MFKRILVPLDGSQLAERALPVAVTLGRATQGTVYILRSTVEMGLPIVPPTAGTYATYDWLPGSKIMDEIEKEAQNYLQELSEEYAAPDVRWRTSVINADPASAIVDFAAHEAVELIVMTSHGHSGLQRWVLGSVTERVLREAPCPVFVVGDARPIHRILVPLDGSELAEQVLAPVLEVARLLSASLTLLHVEQQPVGGEVTVAQLERQEHDLSETPSSGKGEPARNYLQAVVDRHRDRGLEMDTALVEGRPAAAILDYADQHDIDLIAMATHGRSGIRRWIYGSVTEKVLHATHSSLLVVRPPWAD